MFSRTGSRLELPQEIIDEMPQDSFLDGELWYVLYAKNCPMWLTELNRFGRNNFQESMKIAHRMDHDKIHWNSFRFMVFDIPTSKGRFYSERYQQLRMTGLL